MRQVGKNGRNFVGHDDENARSTDLQTTPEANITVVTADNELYLP